MINYFFFFKKKQKNTQRYDTRTEIQLPSSVLVSVCYLSPGQFPSTFVEEVTIPSTKPGDRLYVCINDFNATDIGSLSLKRGMDTSLFMKYVSLWSIVTKLHFNSNWKGFRGRTSRCRKLLLTLTTHVFSLSQHCLLMSLGWGNFYFVVLHLRGIVIFVLV